MAEIISGVYKITNTITGDFYIGSSKNIEKRWAHHKCKSTWMQTAKLYQAFNKYGIKNFRLEIIEKTSDLNNRKKYWINKLHPYYNTKRTDFDECYVLQKYCYYLTQPYKNRDLNLAVLDLLYYLVEQDNHDPLGEIKKYLDTEEDVYTKIAKIKEACYNIIKNPNKYNYANKKD